MSVSAPDTAARIPPETQAVSRPPFEVADIVRRHGDRFLETHRAWLTSQHRRVLRALVQCRTAALGGHRDRCETCAQPGFSYNSCRDRHCPKCLTAARDAWVAAREQELLPVGYVHVVFTMPEVLARLALVNKRVVYDLLFKASAATLLAGRGESETARGRHRRADGLAHVGPALAASSAHPLRRARRRSVVGRRTVDPRAPDILPAGTGPPTGLSRETGGRSARGVCAGPAVVSRCAPATRHGGRLSRVSSIALSPDIGWSTRSHRLAVLPTCCTTSRGTPTASRSPITGSSPSPTTPSRFAGRIIATAARSARLPSTREEFLRRFLLHVLPKRFVRIRYFGVLAPRCRTARSGTVSPGPGRRCRRPHRPTRPSQRDRRARGRAPAVAGRCASSNG